MNDRLPVPEQERFHLLDSLRGFAILGIFIFNISVNTFADTSNPAKLWWDTTAIDKVLTFLNEMLIEGKFYSIFSLLFGIGFGLQINRRGHESAASLGLFKRRLWVMLLIGFMHMLLIWIGDILFIYAYMGFVLILFRNKSDKFLLRFALFSLLVPVLLFPLRFISPYITLGLPLGALMEPVAGALGFNLKNTDIAVALTDNTWSGYFRFNLMGMLFRQYDLLDQVRPFKVLALFLLGFWISRHGFYERVNQYKSFLKKVILIGLPAGLVINYFMASIPWSEYYAGSMKGWAKTLLYALGVTPLSMSYVAMFALAHESGKAKWLEGFSYVGRMALSNYLLQSILYMVLFRGVFLGLAGKFGFLPCLGIVAVVYTIQLLLSKWWLARYRFGPAEWLWRSATYGKWQTMKR